MRFLFSMLDRFKETTEQQKIIEADATVISQAAPPDKPSTPGPVLFGAVGLTASMMLGTLLALLLERLDSGLRSAKQVEQHLGLPALGLVPRVERPTVPGRSSQSWQEAIVMPPSVMP